MRSVNFNTVPVGVIFSGENIDRIAARAVEVAKAFAARLARIQATFDEARQKYGAEARELVQSTPQSGRQVARQFAKQQEATRIGKLRASLVESTKAEREDLLNALAKLASEAEFLSTLCASPAQMLGRVALGEARRTNLIQQLEGAGPVELETAAKVAITTNDLPLASAIVTIIDRRSLDSRPFGVAEFAGRIYGEEHKRIAAKLTGTQLAYKTAIAANAEFIRGRADPLTNLSNQLARRAAAEAAGDDEDEA